MEITISTTVSQLCLRNTDLVYQYEDQIIGDHPKFPKNPFHLIKETSSCLGAWKAYGK